MSKITSNGPSIQDQLAALQQSQGDVGQVVAKPAAAPATEAKPAVGMPTADALTTADGKPASAVTTSHIPATDQGRVAFEGIQKLSGLAAKAGVAKGDASHAGDVDIDITVINLQPPPGADHAKTFLRMGEVFQTDNDWAQGEVTRVIQAEIAATESEHGEDIAKLFGSSAAAEQAGLIQDGRYRAGAVNSLATANFAALGGVTAGQSGEVALMVLGEAKNHTPPAAIAGRWEQFTAGLAAGGGNDVNALIQWVLRESYLETTKDLYYYAEKVRFFNECKRKIRDEIKGRQDMLAHMAGDEETAGVPGGAFAPTQFNTTFSAAQAEGGMESAGTIQAREPTAAEIAETERQQALDAAVARYQQNLTTAAPNATTSARSGQTGNKQDFGNASQELSRQITAEWDRVKDDPTKREAFIKELQEKGITIGGSGVEEDVFFDDSFSYSNTYKFDPAVEDVETFLARVVDDVVRETEARFNAQSGGDPELLRVNFSYSMSGGTGYVDPTKVPLEPEMVAAGYQPGGIPPGQMGGASAGATADGWSPGQPIETKADLQAYVDNLESELQQVGDDAQLANVDLQNMLQKQQQTMQMMSNIAKMLHDTAMSIIRKIGG